MKPDLAFIEKLIELVSKNNVAEVEVHFNRGQKIRVSKVGGQALVSATGARPTQSQVSVDSYKVAHVPAATAPAAEETTEAKPARAANLVAITSPMVGTFYRAPAPDAPPYVEVGDALKPGTVVCIVEAMKLMNEIESEVSGRVAEILVANETPVEYGQELFLVEPS
jgi:acetyl-CoA carboxylase biotin carboxyl carrier protein